MSDKLLQSWQSLTPEQQQTIFPFLNEEAKALISGVGWEPDEDTETITCSGRDEDFPPKNP